MRRLALLALLALSACARSDFDKICNSEQLSGADKIADPAQCRLAAARWLEGHVRSDDARSALAAFAGSDGNSGDKATRLLFMARNAGYHGPCPFADDYLSDLAPRMTR